MSKSGKGAQLACVLNAHVQSIHETLQVSQYLSSELSYTHLLSLCVSIIDQAVLSSAGIFWINRPLHLSTRFLGLNWGSNLQTSDHMCVTTSAGMLWNERKPDVKEVEENLGAYFNMLHGFILLCHGSTAGAGRTLHSCICASAKQVTDSSLSLLAAVSSYGSSNAGSRISIPQLSGSVWEACVSLKKTPTANSTAIGRAVTQVAVSVKDVLREMRELKPASCTDPTDGTPDGADVVAPEANDEGSSMEGDFDDGLLPEEMNIAQIVISVTSDTLLALKEVIRFLAGLLKSGDHESSTNDYIESLERLLQHCQEFGAQVGDLGACVYPPQEIPSMQSAARKMNCAIVDVQTQIERISGSHEVLQGAFEGLKSSLKLGSVN